MTQNSTGRPNRDDNSTRKDFFISYTGTDRTWAEWIAWQLEEAQYSIILQAWDFLPGANFVVEMNRATKEARRTIAVLSPAYLDALHTYPEWAAALVQSPTSHKKMLLPVKVEAFEPEGLFAAIVYVDLTELSEEEEPVRS